MVDPGRRKKLAQHLRHLFDGVISHEEFESRVMDDVTFGWVPDQYHNSKRAQADDAAIVPLLLIGLRLYADLKEGSNQLNDTSRNMIARCLLFLNSEMEYVWPDFEPAKTSSRDLLLSVLTLGYWSRRKSGEAKLLYSAWQQNGDFDVWPFLKTSDYTAQLQKSILNGAA